MSNVFTLDTARKDVDTEYAEVPVDLGGGDIVTLRHLLRIPKTGRESAYKLLAELESETKGVDKDDTQGSLEATEMTAAIALQLICIVADDAEKAEALVDAIQDDVPLTLRLFNAWMESTQAGEAEGSAS
jgi:hypothetical protein